MSDAKPEPTTGTSRTLGPEPLEVVHALSDHEHLALAAVEHAARLVMNLPEQHPSERVDMAAAFHVIQNEVVARPMWRALNRCCHEGGWPEHCCEPPVDHEHDELGEAGA